MVPVGRTQASCMWRSPDARTPPTSSSSMCKKRRASVLAAHRGVMVHVMSLMGVVSFEEDPCPLFRMLYLLPNLIWVPKVAMHEASCAIGYQNLRTPHHSPLSGSCSFPCSTCHQGCQPLFLEEKPSTEDFLNSPSLQKL